MKVIPVSIALPEIKRDRISIPQEDKRDINDKKSKLQEIKDG